jgi:hypothetical protein
VPVAGVGQHCGIKESCFAVQLWASKVSRHHRATVVRIE